MAKEALMPPQNRRSFKQRHPETYSGGVTRGEARRSPCHYVREGLPCPFPAGECPHDHSICTGKPCTDSERQKTGLCSKFKSCRDKHTDWNEAKWGKKEDVLKKALEGENIAFSFIAVFCFYRR